VLGGKTNVGQKHGLQRRQAVAARQRLLRRLLNARQQLLRHPGHGGLQQGLFAGEMLEQRPLGYTHVLGNAGGAQLAGVGAGGQLQHGLDGGGAPLLRAQVFGCGYTLAVRGG